MQGGQVRQIRSSRMQAFVAGPGCGCRRWCGRGGTGRRACRWPTPIPSAARSHRRSAVRLGSTGACAAQSDPTGGGAAGGADVLGGDEIRLADQRRVYRRTGDDPPVGQVPPLHRLMSQGNIASVDQVAVGPLPVPHLTARIPRVRQDRSDRAQRPARTGTVRVPARVGRRRARHARRHSAPARSAPPNGPPAAGRRSTGRCAPFPGRVPDGGRGGPRRRGPCSGAARHHPAGTRTAGARPDTGPAPAPGPPSQSAPGCWSWSPPASTTAPAPSSPAHHARTRSRPGRPPPASTTARRNARTAAPWPRTGSRRTLAHTPPPRSRPSPDRVRQQGDQRGGFRTPAPRHSAALPGVEELRHDHPMAPDQRLRLLPLPRPRRHRVLPVLRRHPPVEHEPQTATHRSPGLRGGLTAPPTPPGHPRPQPGQLPVPLATVAMVATSPEEPHSTYLVSGATNSLNFLRFTPRRQHAVTIRERTSTVTGVQPCRVQHVPQDGRARSASHHGRPLPTATSSNDAAARLTRLNIRAPITCMLRCMRRTYYLFGPDTSLGRLSG